MGVNYLNILLEYIFHKEKLNIKLIYNTNETYED